MRASSRAACPPCCRGAAGRERARGGRQPQQLSLHCAALRAVCAVVFSNADYLPPSLLPQSTPTTHNPNNNKTTQEALRRRRRGRAQGPLAGRRARQARRRAALRRGRGRRRAARDVVRLCFCCLMCCVGGGGSGLPRRRPARACAQGSRICVEEAPAARPLQELNSTKHAHTLVHNKQRERATGRARSRSTSFRASSPQTCSSPPCTPPSRRRWSPTSSR